MNLKFTDEENKTNEDVSENRMIWQTPELIIFDIDKTQGGNNPFVSESNCGSGVFS